MTMSVLKPTAITDAMFVSSTVSESDYPVWNGATAYAVNDTVIVTTGYHRIYRRLVAGTTATHPSLDTANWYDLGPTNRWAMFDKVVGTVTTGAVSPLAVEIAPGRANAIALLGLYASSVRVQVTSVADGLVYDQTYAIPDASVVTSWYEYFFSPVDLSDTLLVRDLPIYGDCTIKITVSSGGSPMVGVFLAGLIADFGMTQYGARSGITDYSSKTRDPFGRATLVKRDFNNTMDINVFVDGSKTDAVKRQLAALRATEVLWIGAEQYTSLVVYGFFKDFNVQIPYPNLSLCTLSIEGLT